MAIAADGTITWNDTVVSLEELAQRLEQTRKMPEEPELTLEPDPSAPYDMSVAVLQVIKESGATKFGFVGNEKYKVPGETEN